MYWLPDPFSEMKWHGCGSTDSSVSCSSPGMPGSRLLSALVPVQEGERHTNLSGHRARRADPHPPNRIPATIEQPARLGQVGVEELVLDGVGGLNRREERACLIAVDDYRHASLRSRAAAACHVKSTKAWRRLTCPRPHAHPCSVSG